MTTYVIPFIIFYFIVIISIPYINSDKQFRVLEVREKAVFLLVVFILFWGWGLVGWDTRTYYKMYQEIPKLDELRSYNIEREYLFYYWFSLLKTLGFKYVTFRIINTSVDLLILFIFFDYFLDRKYIPFAIVMYCLYGGMYFEIEAIRNAKAISCYLISLIFWDKKQYIMFIILNICAFYFHIAIIILPVSMLFYRLFLKRKLVLILFFIGCLMAVSGIGLGTIIVMVSDKLPGIIGMLVRRYVLSDFYNSSHGLTIGFIERVFFFYLVFKNQNRLIKDYPKTKIFIVFFYYYTFFCFYFLDFTIIIERIAAMYKISYWIIVPLIYNYFDQKKKYTFYGFFFLYGVLKMLQQYSGDIYRIHWSVLN